MKSVESIPAQEALKILLQRDDSVAAVDVRSESEFSQGALPGFQNIPILRDEERHQVGLCYRQEGQSAAIALGNSLVAGHRDSLIQKWADSLKLARWPLLACWRGGLRSKIACEWIREAGVRTLRVEGGYKALRKECLVAFEELPEFLVVSGPTGSGKTALIRQVELPHLDLEGLAHHRGSAFGREWQADQPSQGSFENEVAFGLLRQKGKRLLAEDESLLIGQVHLPLSLRNKMKDSPLVRIQMDVEARVENLFADYIEAPLEEGVSPVALQEYYEASLTKIRNRLGGLLETQIRGTMKEAFARSDAGLHRDWIRELLVHYYDKTYDYSFKKTARDVAFQGDWTACKQWIQNQFV